MTCTCIYMHACIPLPTDTQRLYKATQTTVDMHVHVHMYMTLLVIFKGNQLFQRRDTYCTCVCVCVCVCMVGGRDTGGPEIAGRVCC